MVDLITAYNLLHNNTVIATLVKQINNTQQF
jgi:hypothetical protein